MSSLLPRQQVVKEVLQKHCYHRVWSHPRVKRRKPNPQPNHSFIFYTLRKAVHKALVRQFPSSVQITQSLLFFIFSTFVFTLSKGSEHNETAIPEMAEAVSRMDIVSFFSPVNFMSCSLDSLYPTRWEQLTAMALAMVGTEPLHSPASPSSEYILPKASNTFLQFLLSAGGRLLSDWNRMRAISVGLAITDPTAPVKSEQATFSPKVRFLFSLAFTLSYITLNSPSLIPQQMNCLRMAESSPLQSPKSYLLYLQHRWLRLFSGLRRKEIS